MYRYVKIPIALLCLSAIAHADVPRQINHQGVVSVNGVRFEGPGEFRFAIVDPETGVNLWSNDGSITDAVGGTPTAAVSLTVTNGVYSVDLGDTSVTNMTDEIAPSVFADDNAVLRIWFDDSVNGVQQLTLDHKLTASPYSHRADNGIPTAGIIMWSGTVASIPSGWALCDGTNGTPDLRNRFVYGVDTAENPGATGGSTTHYHDVPVGNTGNGKIAVSDNWAGSGVTFPSTWKVDRDDISQEDVIAQGTKGPTNGSHFPPYFRLAFIMKLE